MSKGLWVLAALAVVLVVAGSGAGYAAMPSLYGPTGIVSVPNALVAPMGQITGALTYQRLQQINNAAMYTDGVEDVLLFDEEDSSLWALQALAGVANGAELWAAYSKDNSDFNVKTWGIGGKYQFNAYEKGTDQPKFAIGASYKHATGDNTGIAAFLENIGTYEVPDIVETDFDASFDLTEKVTDVYAVATFDFTSMGASEWGAGSKLLGSVGMLWKRVDASMDVHVPDAATSFAFDMSETLTRPFLGLEYEGADKTGLGIEYRWKDNDLDAKAVWSAVLRHQFDKGISVEVGTTNANQLGLGMDNQNWFARVGYTFAMGSY
jgi:hypothetical protein